MVSAYIKLENHYLPIPMKPYMHDVELLYEFLQNPPGKKNVEKLIIRPSSGIYSVD